MTQRYQAILFDLDGTLLDTAPDLGKALNCLLSAHNRPQFTTEQIRPSAGRGSRGLIKLGFGLDANDARFTPLCDDLLSRYADCLLDTTQLFPGMSEVLSYLDDKTIPWGIVTNKPERFTRIILSRLQLHHRAQCVISGDTLARRKPFADPLLHACNLLALPPEHCLYVGDSEVDTLACQAAAIDCLVALYGYIPPDENPTHWHAKGTINAPLDLLQWL